MLRCFIVDDEPPAINLLTQYINETPFLQLIGSATDPTQALNEIKSLEIDILFLDIQMPKITGFELIEILKPKCSVIMTTAFTEYAISGYEYQVSDYLVKPIRYERFLKAVTKVLNEFPKVASNIKANEDEFLFVKTEHRGKFKKIEYSDIKYVEGLQNYIRIYLKSQDNAVVTYIRIGEILEKLPLNKFVRVHKSYIVALDEIEALDGNEIFLKTLSRIPAGGVYKSELLEKFKDSFIIGNQKKGGLK
ncbi:two component transcriptional regulator, LytTR family (plasmid) [Emticicia oligotrophica DSM 17448]|uniref:Two component transcriptional regulator, LytTR family n=1 Tax=Emticicia oligotrophica (strain DSM 17448 / CIP 109782 / MTCC 6937 / GPTSA100-15) TaxID=929562 RepID=A0ABN4ASA2_EMTOG|nr:LytTR family DNA-binding domain-containing protein [Emticicia oligotrophica]AFK05505.1 two component transcriptional regulator, LytTR family [Emticicia oligotrophica DSM 17448]